jgi:hypothetical protein
MDDQDEEEESETQCDLDGKDHLKLQDRRPFPQLFLKKK